MEAFSGMVNSTIQNSPILGRISHIPLNHFLTYQSWWPSETQQFAWSYLPTPKFLKPQHAHGRGGALNVFCEYSVRSGFFNINDTKRQFEAILLLQTLKTWHPWCLSEATCSLRSALLPCEMFTSQLQVEQKGKFSPFFDGTKHEKSEV